MLTEELRQYANPAAGIRRMTDAGLLTPIIKGLYETDASTPGHLSKIRPLSICGVQIFSWRSRRA